MGTSCSSTTPLEQWNLRAKLAKVYEDGKDDPNDMATLEEFCDQFSTNVSLRRTGHTGTPPFGTPPVGDGNFGQFVRDPVGPVKTKGRPKNATRIKSGVETSNENRRKRSCGYCGEVGHISTGCAKRRLHAQSQGDSVDR